MWDNISWLDIVSFLLAIVTFLVAWKTERQQTRYLRHIAKKEKDIEQKIDERDKHKRIEI